jgi:hypothetical protein
MLIHRLPGPTLQEAHAAGVAAFLDSITAPAHEGRFTLTLHEKDGGKSVQHCNSRELAATLVKLVQGPHVIDDGDSWIIERVSKGAESRAAAIPTRISDALTDALADLGIDAADPEVHAVLARHLNHATRQKLDDAK